MKTADELCDYLRDIWNNRLGFPHSEVRDELVRWKRDIEAGVRQLALPDTGEDKPRPFWGFEGEIPHRGMDPLGELRARLGQLEGRVERVELENQADHPFMHNLNNRISYLESGHIRADDGSGPEVRLHAPAARGWGKVEWYAAWPTAAGQTLTEEEWAEAWKQGLAAKESEA